MPDRKEHELHTVTDLKKEEPGLPVKMNFDEDAWEYGAPPPKGVYQLKLFLAKDGIKAGSQNDNAKDIFYSVSLECRIVSDNELYDEIPVFTRVDTRLYRGKNISTMAGLLVAAGARKHMEQMGETLTPKALSELLEKVLKKEPVVPGEVDWRGSYQMKNAKGEDTWVNALRRYEDFPMLPDGSGRNYETSITDKTTGMVYDVRAQSYVARFFKKSDTIPKYDAKGIVKEIRVGTAGVSPGLVSAPRSHKAIVDGVPSPVVTSMPTVLPVTVAAEEVEMDLLLEP